MAGVSAWAQKDVTSTYIKNATLSSLDGWTNVNFNNPVKGNNTVGYAVECYEGWSAVEKSEYSLTQKITLPAGNYTLVNYSFFREGAAYNTDAATSRAYLKAGDNQVLVKTLGSITAAGYANSQAEGANAFDSKMYRNTLDFTIDADNTEIEIGVYGTFNTSITKSWMILGMFELIDNGQLATQDSPFDVTGYITNPGFEYRNLSGWTRNPDNDNSGVKYQNNNWGNKSGIGFAEAWQGAAGLPNRSISQTITNLPDGLYRLSVNAHNINQNASGAAGNGMFVYADDKATEIGAYDNYVVNTVVDDGTLEIGIKLDGCTGNWIAFDNFKLQFCGDVVASLATLVDQATTLLNDERYENGKADLQAAITSVATPTDYLTEIDILTAAIATYKSVNAPVFDGKYYIQNVNSGKLMAGGHNWGTKGIVNDLGLDFTMVTANKVTTFDSQLSNGGSNHFLSDALWTDGGSFGFTIDRIDGETYSISNGTKYIGVDANDELVFVDEPVAWYIHEAATFEAQRLAANLATLEAATLTNPVDATFLIKTPNFNRNDQRNATNWTVSADCTNKNLAGGGSDGNGCAESYHSTFTVSQLIKKLPRGTYRLSAQGFYRQDGSDNDNLPYFFANDAKADVPLLTGAENSMGDAGVSFTAGNYTISPIEFYVSNGDDLTVGVANPNNANLWVIWDNFQLTYYGPERNPATAVDYLPLDVTFPDYNEAEVASYTKEWTALVKDYKWTLNGFNNQNSSWDYVACGQKRKAQTATIASPAFYAEVSDVVINVIETSNVEKATVQVIDQDNAVLETVDVTDQFQAAAEEVQATLTKGTRGCSYLITIESKAGENGSTKISKVTVYSEGQYINVPALKKEAQAMVDADAEAVAVGKLQNAIDATLAIEDAAALKAAMEQFQKDNADQEDGRTAKVVYAEVLEQLKAEIAAAKELLNSEAAARALEPEGDANAAIKADLEAAITAAEVAAESNKLNIEELKAEVEKLKAAEEAYQKAIGGVPVVFDEQDGKHYIKNLSTGKFWGAGNSWGTQASLVKNPEYVTLAKQPDGTYTMESQVSNGGTAYYFNGSYMDNGSPVSLTITKSGNYYTIANGETYYGYNGTNTVIDEAGVDGTSKNALWVIYNEEQMLATLDDATAENPVDATFLILNPNFGRNNRNADAWQIEASNKNLSGGDNTNRCAESYHSVFTLTQTITGVPNGKYKLTAQGFYRQDGTDEENLPYFYINDQKGTFPVKTGTENSMTDASASFTKGEYQIEPIEATVIDGTITLGAKLETNTALWCIWDNFELTYCGPAAVDIQVYVDAYEKALADANATLDKEMSRNAKEGLRTIISRNDNADKTSQEALVEATKALTDAVAAVQTSVKSYEVIAAGVIADNSIENWTCSNTNTFHVNTWSVEGNEGNDPTGMTTPFIENWVAKPGPLGNGQITYTLKDVDEAAFKVTAYYRIYSESGEEPAGAMFFVGDQKTALQGTSFEYNEMKGIYGTVEGEGVVDADGNFKFGFDIADATFNWIAIKNVTIQMTGLVGITTLKSTVDFENNAVYNLNGQKVERPAKGLYIVNGKKVVIK